MIQPAEINAIATRAARAKLPTGVVQRVFSEPTVTWLGEDALRLTIVLAPNSVQQIDGDAVLDTLVEIQRDLQRAGDERLAIVEYATEDDLLDVGD
jgi:hypothetical protein